MKSSIISFQSEQLEIFVSYISKYNYYFFFPFRPNYEAKNIRLNSVTGWCGKQETFTYVSVDLGQVYRVKVILILF